MSSNGTGPGISRRKLLRYGGSGLALTSAIGIAPRYLTRPAHAAELAPGMTGGPTGFPGCERYQYNGDMWLAWRLDHLARMTDATGMLQHATHTIPNFAEGYCTDDNARALLLTVLLEELGHGGPEVQRFATTYAAFLQAAFDRDRTHLNGPFYGI